MTRNVISFADLKNGRVDHACGVMPLGNGDNAIVIAGGRWVDSVYSTVEIITLAPGQDLATAQVKYSMVWGRQ